MSDERPVRIITSFIVCIITQLLMMLYIYTHLGFLTWILWSMALVILWILLSAFYPLPVPSQLPRLEYFFGFYEPNGRDLRMLGLMIVLGGLVTANQQPEGRIPFLALIIFCGLTGFIAGLWKSGAFNRRDK